MHARAAIVAAALSLAAVVVVPSPARAVPQASPPCFGASCVGKSPYTGNSFGNCITWSVPITGSGLYVYGDADIQMMWSDWCQANWIRWNTTMGYTPVNNGFYAQTANGHKEYNGTRQYTNMTDGSQLVQECVKIPQSSSPYSCLGWW